MADLGVFTKNADIQARAGGGADATAKATAATDVYVQDIESYICAITNYDWVTNYGSLATLTKLILKDCGACLCAAYVVNAEMNGYTSLEYAIQTINFCWARADKCISLLKEASTIKEITGAP